jgi:two-component system OmpR family response regulator
VRLLLVDDEVKFAKSLQKVLQSEGYAVDVAHDGQTAYDLLIDEVYDLALLDIGLPLLNGLDLCRQLRAEHIKVPVLMLTARDATSDTIIGLDSGADDYLVKPFAVEELLARMRSLLRRGSTGVPLILQVADVSLDPASRRVMRADRTIDLSAKEYALLEFLMRHPGHILSKQQILDHVWDADLDPFSNVVDVYVGYLRAKIDRPFAGPHLITTIKGLGYRIGE